MRSLTLALLAVALLFVIAPGAAAAAPARQGSLPAEVVDVTWNLSELTLADGSAVDVSVAQATLQLASGGQASGSGGCNNFTGGYTVGSAQEITIGPLASTLRLCTPDAVNALEQSYTQALEAVNSYSVDGDTLTLTADGGPTLRFTRGDAAADGDGGAAAGGTTPGTLPSTGGESDAAALLLFAALLAAGGLWLRRRI
jgi:LPXTG-motif cell wall-anchored protein